jgi:hypothetical protein
MISCRFLLAVFALPLALACARHDSSADARGLDDTVGSARHLIVVPPTTTPYRVVPVGDGGSVTGTVTYADTLAVDSVIHVPADQNGCGKELDITRLKRTKGAVADVVVWLTDIRAGHALPLDRRYTLANTDCAWDPMIQTVVTGGTLNVVNQDPLVERAYITNVATGDTVAQAPFTDNGQVIPYDKLFRAPGVYELSIESRPVSRAWVVAIDHPYVTITKNDGRFTLDSIPPGTYHIRAWHPTLGVTDGTVRVVAGQETALELRFP